MKNASTKDTDYPSISDIKQYSDYLEFKRGTYSGSVNYNVNGRIDSMTYVQK